MNRLVCSVFAIAMALGVSTSAVPSAPTSLSAIVSGASVTLTWNTPGGVIAHRLEAGTAPGLTDAANTIVGASPVFFTSGVPNGVYYVRVRAIDATGESDASNEVVVTVGSTGCVGAPAAPTGFSHTVSGSIVNLSWVPPAGGCPPTTYVITAGSGPSRENLATLQATGPGVTVSAPNGTYYVRVYAFNISGFSAPSNERTIVVGSPGPPPPPPASSFGPGQYRVNIDLPPGRYYSSPLSGCYWERQKGFSGSSSDIIANEFIGHSAAQWIVEILSTDAGFETDSGCGRWFTTPRAGALADIPPGVWLVGSQIAAGTYRVNAGAGCYWARLRDFTGNSSGIIDNDFNSSAGQRFVTILSTDVGFENDGDCGTWTRVSGDTRVEPAADQPPDIDLQWMLNYQQRRGREPRPLVKQ